MLIEVLTTTLGALRFELREGGKAKELRSLTATKLSQAPSAIKLVSKGQLLEDDDAVSTEEAILALVSQSQRARGVGSLLKADGGPTEADADEINLRLPATCSARTRKVFNFLQKDLCIPEFVLALLVQVRLQIWIGLLLWVAAAPLAAKLGFGELYVLGTILVLVFYNLGSRREGEASAYSIFNNFRRLPGQLTADELDRQVRTGQM